MRNQGKGSEIFQSGVAFLLGLLFLLTSTVSAAARAKHTTDLRSDSLTQPLGIDSPKPMVSRRFEDDARGAKQTAYEFLVYGMQRASELTTPDVGDSGRVP